MDIKDYIPLFWLRLLNWSWTAAPFQLYLFDFFYDYISFMWTPSVNYKWLFIDFKAFKMGAAVGFGLSIATQSFYEADGETF